MLDLGTTTAIPRLEPTFIEVQEQNDVTLVHKLEDIMNSIDGRGVWGISYGACGLSCGIAAHTKLDCKLQ